MHWDRRTERSLTGDRVTEKFWNNLSHSDSLRVCSLHWGRHSCVISVRGFTSSNDGSSSNPSPMRSMRGGFIFRTQLKNSDILFYNHPKSFKLLLREPAPRGVCINLRRARASSMGSPWPTLSRNSLVSNTHKDTPSGGWMCVYVCCMYTCMWMCARSVEYP